MKAKKEKRHKSIEDIVRVAPTDKIRRDLIIEGVVFSLPLLISFVWYVNVILSVTSDSENLRLSPVGAEPLVVLLFAFIIIYGIFLIFEFKMLWNKLKEAKKKSSKKMA